MPYLKGIPGYKGLCVDYLICVLLCSLDNWMLPLSCSLALPIFLYATYSLNVRIKYERASGGREIFFKYRMSKVWILVLSQALPGFGLWEYARLLFPGSPFPGLIVACLVQIMHEFNKRHVPVLYLQLCEAATVMAVRRGLNLPSNQFLLTAKTCRGLTNF